MNGDPNEIGRVTLRRRILSDGSEQWYTKVAISSSTVSTLRAVMALQSGIKMAVEKVLSGDLPAPGNGEVTQIIGSRETAGGSR